LDGHNVAGRNLAGEDFVFQHRIRRPKNISHGGILQVRHMQHETPLPHGKTLVPLTGIEPVF